MKEDAPARPQSATRQLFVETERRLLDAARARKFPAVILRVAGIYGLARGGRKGKTKLWVDPFS